MKSRREFLHDMLPALLSYSLMRTLVSTDALAAPAQSEFASWVASVHQCCRDLRIHRISPQAWQSLIGSLLTRISVRELLQAIDFDRLEKKLRYPDLGVDTQAVGFPDLDPPSGGWSFFSKVFGLKPHRAIIPHGHRHMASAHLVLGGSFHLRQYERVEADERAWVVRPSIDELIAPGHVSSISDEMTNVHWLVAGQTPAYTLDLIVVGLTAGAPLYEIQNLDPDHSEKLSGGLIRMPALDVDEALRRYGKSHHA